MPKISVFVPTYCRSKSLERCLDALKKQSRLPDEIVLTVRDTDYETQAFLKSYTHSPLTITVAEVSELGVLAAHNQGYKTITSEIVAITDDDAAPTVDWLAAIEKYFSENPDVGGYGGRDLLYENGELCKFRPRSEVGQVKWFGHVIGNHHLGLGKARTVDILKGVNSSYRYEVISGFQYANCLKGMGTNSHWELALGLHAKSQQWQLVYDPSLLVDHYPGERVGMAKRGWRKDPQYYESQKLIDSVFNQTYILMSHLSKARRISFLVWALLVGSRGERGILQCLRFLPSEGRYSVVKSRDSIKGRLLGWQEWRRLKEVA